MEALDAVTTYLGYGSYKDWDEPTKLEFLTRELNTRRPLIPLNMPMSDEVMVVPGPGNGDCTGPGLGGGGREREPDCAANQGEAPLGPGLLSGAGPGCRPVLVAQQRS
jgi:hypothetical protein